MKHLILTTALAGWCLNFHLNIAHAAQAHAAQKLTPSQTTAVQNFFPKGVTLFHFPGERGHVKFSRLHKENVSEAYFLYNAFSNGKDLAWRISTYSDGYLPKLVSQCANTAILPPKTISFSGQTWTVCDDYLYTQNAKQSAVIYLPADKVKRLYPKGGEPLKRALLNELKRVQTETIKPFPAGSWAKEIKRLQTLENIMIFRAKNYALAFTGLTWSNHQQQRPLVEFSYRNIIAENAPYDVRINLLNPGVQMSSISSCESSNGKKNQTSVLNHPTLGAFKVCTVLGNRTYDFDPKAAYFYPQNKLLGNMYITVSFRDESDLFPPLLPILAQVEKL